MKRKMMIRLAGTACMISAAVLFAARAAGDTVNWKSGIPNYSSWHDPANWVEGKVPADGDDVIIAYGIPLLTNATAKLKSLFINNRTLVVSNNWNATIYAETLQMTNSLARIAAHGAFTDAGPSNRIHVVCSNLTVSANHSPTVAAFLADYAGYSSDNSMANSPGYGPGRGLASYFGNGGNYGGAGGATPMRFGTVNNTQGSLLTYGSAEEPLEPGSGGGTAATPVWRGGDGGGAIFIDASGDVVLNGMACSANGEAATGYGGGGSGGAILIKCRTISGSGIIRANGGNRGTEERSASGGGGRIAIHYDTEHQTTIPDLRLEVNPGRDGGFPVGEADPGTIWLPNRLFLTETIDKLSGQIIVPDFTEWNPDNLTIDNCWVRFPVDGFGLKVVGNMTITGDKGRYDVGGDTYAVALARVHRPLSSSVPLLEVGGNLELLSGGSLGVYSTAIGAFDGSMGDTNIGAHVKVEGDMQVDPGSRVYPYSHSTDGGSPLFTMRNLTVSEGGGFDANYKGCAIRFTGYGFGTGQGVGTNGASYGGRGGPVNSPVVKPTYGSETAPNLPGSSGGTTSYHWCFAGAGGGLIQIVASDTVRLDGELAANGYHGRSYESLNTQHGLASGGSGGGIHVVCRHFHGEGSLSATGGDSWWDVGCGGGGRIAVWRMFDEFEGAATVAGGTKTNIRPAVSATEEATYPGEDGTVYWGDIPRDGTLLLAR